MSRPVKKKYTHPCCKVGDCMECFGVMWSRDTDRNWREFIKEAKIEEKVLEIMNLNKKANLAMSKRFLAMCIDTAIKNYLIGEENV